MYEGNLAKKYETPEGKGIGKASDVKDLEANDMVKTAADIGHMEDPKEKYEKIKEFYKGKNNNVIYLDFVRKMQKDLVTDDFYMDNFKDIAKNIHEDLDDRIKKGKKTLAKPAAEHYAMRLGALVSTAFGYSNIEDLDEKDRLVAYQRIQSEMQSIPLDKDKTLWDEVVNQIKAGHVQQAYAQISTVYGKIQEGKLEAAIEDGLDMDDYKFKKAAGEELTDELNEYLDDVGKEVHSGFVQEAAKDLTKARAQHGLESVIKHLEDSGKID